MVQQSGRTQLKELTRRLERPGYLDWRKEERPEVCKGKETRSEKFSLQKWAMSILVVSGFGGVPMYGCPGLPYADAHVLYYGPGFIMFTNAVSLGD